MEHDFLEGKYGLHNRPEVESAAKRTEKRTGEKVPQNPEARIQNYLNRFKEIIERRDLNEKERGIVALKKILVDAYVIRVEDIPESYWHAQMRMVRSRGESGDWQTLSDEQVLEEKKRHLAQTKEDQKGSLEEWIDYLASDKSSYLPDHLKYWIFQSMLRLERYEKGDKEKSISGKFPKRPSGRQRSVKMFPEVNERGLKGIAEAYKAELKNQSLHFRYDIPKEARQQFSDHLKKKDFRALYGLTQEYLPPISEAEMKTTEGEWVLYPKNSDPKVLTATLQGKGSGWCIAGEQLAGQYLNTGDLYIYYSNNTEGNPTIPRVVIVQKDNHVTEVRGIEWEENVDEYIKRANIIGDKLRNIPGGELFFGIDEDTKRLTMIDRAVSDGKKLTKDDLVFLYEIEKPIKYFGYKKDPRIEELRKQRNPQEDMLVVFECSKDQIAHSIGEIKEGTKAYVGSLVPGIFDKIQEYDIEHIYTSFPEGRIRKETIEIGGKDFKGSFKELEEKNIHIDFSDWENVKTALAKIDHNEVGEETLQFLEELVKKQINISDYAMDMLQNKDFTVLKKSESEILIRLKVGDLGVPRGEYLATDEIYKRIEELGLELCPAETGPHYRLKYLDQPMDEWFWIGMKQITARDTARGGPSVFGLARDEGGLWLGRDWAGPGDEWAPDDKFVFRLRKKNSKP